MAEHRIIAENWRGTGFCYHISDGFYYHFHYDTPFTIYFRCRHLRTCRGRAIFNLNTGFQNTQPHSHHPDMLYSQVQAARAGILERARSGVYMSFAEIVRSEKMRIQNEEIRSQLTLRNLRSAMHRARGDAYPSIPQGVPELSLLLEDPAWENLSKTCDMQDSIYLGTAVATDFSVHIVFMSTRCQAYLRIANIVFADGTFFITPSVEGSYQVFTLVTIQGHTVLPLCWALMQSKSQPAYESVLTLIRTHLGTWNFTRVVCDFEDAIINAFRLVFNVDTQGCLFHSADAMARHAKSLFGIHFIHLHCEVEIVIMLCCVLALLPPQFLQRGLNAIGDAAMGLGGYLYEELRPYLLYIQHEWLDHANRGICMSVCGSEHRTNNASETTNKRMKTKFGTPHPNVFHFVRTVAVFEGETMDDLSSLQRGLIPSRSRNVSAVANDRLIIRITNELLNVENPSDEMIFNFLMAASLSIMGLVREALD